MTIDSKTFGGRLKALLLTRSMKQKELAAQIHVTETAISRYIRGGQAARGADLGGYGGRAGRYDGLSAGEGKS